ncbi:hypothetical protein HK097_009664 [Rhizophlyctis rosea]|uniref:TauD/TfdA-like domain-containing protein n=1 Tax=Rhizophlyctis rosea TaxID=64517 RepID=A0AAD5SPL0_9FUNG|nr:hypothetical protein HK097_009664 [Rhizophlyctis rosea]
MAPVATLPTPARTPNPEVKSLKGRVHQGPWSELNDIPDPFEGITEPADPSLLPEGFPAQIEGPGAWDGPELEKRPEEWIHVLTAEELAEIEQNVESFENSGRPFSEINKETFPLSFFSSKTLPGLTDELFDGRGFFLLRGLPVEKWSREQSAIAFLGIGSHIGLRTPQNFKGHVLGHVKDLGYDIKEVGVRPYQTRITQSFHTDNSHVVALLSLKQAKSGGESAIAPFYTIYNHIAKYRPDLIHTLAQDWYGDWKNEHGPNEKPYRKLPALFSHKGKIIYTNPGFFASAPRHEGVPPVRRAQWEVSKAIQSLAQEHAIRMLMQPGDYQYVNNMKVLHSRESFEDYEDVNEKRHLLRLWLRCCPPEFKGWEYPEILDTERVYSTFSTADGFEHTYPLEAE